MSRPLLQGSRLAEIWGSASRMPAFQVLVWNPNRVTINQVAIGQAPDVPLDLTPYVESVQYSENIGFENGDDPSVPEVTINFRRNIQYGRFRRGWLDDGVIVQVFQGDTRVHKEDWLCIFTGTFRGRPGDNPGTRQDGSEGLQAKAYGREERYLNVQVTSDAFPAGVDTGVMAAAIAHNHMGLGQGEILFGAQGFESKHVTNQIVELPALQALWECLFPVGKKPKFDNLGRLTAVDVNFQKPPSRIFTSAGDLLVESVAANPNDVEVNNQVVLRGLSDKMTKVLQESQFLTELEAVTGFFDSEYKERVYFGQDRTQRADGTFLVTKKKIKWSDASWTPVDEFHGVLEIDTKYLRNAQIILFTTYLASQIAIAAIDSYYQGGEGLTLLTSLTGTNQILAALRLALQLLSQAALVGLIWSMNYIGRGRYQIWGKPYENVYQELVSDQRLVGLFPEELRKAEFRNDFISRMEDLDARGRELLRRELVKNQLYEFSLLDDPFLEVDDILETADGCRYYIATVEKELRRGGKPTMKLTCWKVYQNVFVPSAEQLARDGYGYNYGLSYGVGL